MGMSFWWGNMGRILEAWWIEVVSLGLITLRHGGRT